MKLALAMIVVVLFAALVAFIQRWIDYFFQFDDDRGDDRCDRCGRLF